MHTAVIIDDSERARKALIRAVQENCQLNLIGEADSVVSGLKLLKAKQADILFLDIQMGDGSGFDLLELIDLPQTKVIFTTSSDAFAIKAFRFSAVDYLLKPIDNEELVNAVNKAIVNLWSTQNMELLQENIKGHEPFQRIALHTAEKIKVVKLEEIIRCESDVNYTKFFFKNDSSLLVTKTLKSYDKLLSESGFCRVHQSHLINLSHVKEYVKQDGGYILMDDDSNIPISSRKKAEVVRVISELK